MQSITFECEVITPMFLSGADGCTPELRPPSIKGALRFWWRAMNGHLNLEEMKKAEGEIFGDTSQRSKVIIREPQASQEYKRLKYDKHSKADMLPHKEAAKERSNTACFPTKTLFQITLSLIKTVNIQSYTFDLESLKNLFIITCVLGGLGKRSRRGFGSVKIVKTKIQDAEWQSFTMPTTLNHIQALMGNRFTVNQNQITSQNGILNYPYIKTIELGASDSDITKKIINDSHLVKMDEGQRIREEYDYQKDFRGKYKLNKKGEKIPNSRFDNALGNGGRFASPIFVSTIQTNEGLKSIITTLNTVPNGRFEERTHGLLQTAYKNKLKNINNGR